MYDRTIAELSAALERGDFSSVELTRATLEAVEHGAGLNAFITTTPELALAQAQAADQARARGEATALTGVPIAHKDIFCTDGVRTSCGSRMLDGFAPPYDAHVVERMRAAGAVMVGKTNMDEFAMGSSKSLPWAHLTKPVTTGRLKTPGTPPACRVGRLAGRLRPWQRGSLRVPPVPIPAAQFVSRRH
jgi:aspartyl-tRNA(Asn)/glutamyl-tRNA(Gln) amidotransferase subunit A